ncbi:unnamed protein product [Schistocephalus solidus]|uniref:Uncharacterized protein n=1 Tax=Schistocephalus solidus TaxID=70667 RepID=A0A3P7FAD3_SCHSO|nr:unnamed protein product [Schistocephalus solidus]
MLGIGVAFVQRDVHFETLYVEFCIQHLKSFQAMEKESQLQTELFSDIISCQRCKSVAAELISDASIATFFESGLKDTIECPQTALERMVKVASHINEEKRRRQLIDQLHFAGLDVDGWVRLRLRDVFRLPAKKDVGVGLCSPIAPFSSAGRPRIGPVPSYYLWLRGHHAG